MKQLRGAALILIALLVQGLQGQVSEGFLDTHRDRLERLFSELDSSNADIAEIRSVWDAGNRAKAAASLCAFYRSKPFSLEVLDSPLIPANFLEQAEAAIEGRFFLLNEWEPAPRNAAGGIDWEGRGSRNDKERAWMLNRHAWLISLAEAGGQTDNPRFARALNELWAGWILTNPYPDRLTFSAQWRALEVARRILNSWVYGFYGYKALDDETRLLVLSSVLDHADALLEHTSFWGGNHLITEKMALLASAVAWPEFKNSSTWRDDAVRVISNEFMSQTYPDGSYKELSNHYQRVVLTNTTKFLKLLEAVDQSADDQAVVRRIETMWDFFAGVMRPDGLGPLNNAADTEDNAAYLRAVWERFDRPDWLYMASNGTEGTAPSGPNTNPSRLYEYAGQAILRTGWERDASWVYFDAGPYGTAHQHVDRLHVSAALRGRPILVDNGRYVYQPGPWKDYFQGPASHNILLLDGNASEQAPRKIEAPLPVTFEQQASAAFAAAAAFFQPLSALPLFPSLKASIPWTRSVILDQKGRFALIVDHIVSFQSQQWTALWHFHPDLTKEEATGALKLISPHDSLNDTVFVGSGAPNIAGFHSPEYNVKEPAVQRNVSGTTHGPTVLCWLLQSPGQPVIDVKIISQPEDPNLHLQVYQEGGKIAEVRLQLIPKPLLIRFDSF